MKDSNFIKHHKRINRAGILAMSIVLIMAVACKEEEKAPAPKPEPKVVEVVEPDTIPQEEPEPERVQAPPPAPDQYFLIAGSFEDYSNAEKRKSSLADQGMNSEIIQRQYGPNSHFYRVSYMSFSNWNEAITVLNNERNTSGKEDVWLLVKKD